MSPEKLHAFVFWHPSTHHADSTPPISSPLFEDSIPTKRAIVDMASMSFSLPLALMRGIFGAYPTVSWFSRYWAPSFYVTSRHLLEICYHHASKRTLTAWRRCEPLSTYYAFCTLLQRHHQSHLLQKSSWACLSNFTTGFPTWRSTIADTQVLEPYLSSC